MLVDSQDENVEFLGRKSGKDGSSLIVNNNNENGCVNYESTNAKPTSPASNSFEFDKGCVIMTGVRGEAAGSGLIANTSEPIFLTNNFFPRGEHLLRNPGGEEHGGGSGNNFASASSTASTATPSPRRRRSRTWTCRSSKATERAEK